MKTSGSMVTKVTMVTLFASVLRFCDHRDLGDHSSESFNSGGYRSDESKYISRTSECYVNAFPFT